jgi:hypothetical protein
MADPFVVDGTLTYSDEDGLAAEPHGFSFTGSFTVESKFKYSLTGSGSQTVNFGSVALAKVALVTVDYDAVAALIYAQFNGGGASGQLQISPGGGIVYWNPVPASGGISSMIIVHTTAVIVRVRLLG